MAKFKIPVTWVMWGSVEVEADSLEEARELALEAELPKDGNYVEYSFQVDEDMEDY